VTKYQS